MWLYTPIIIWQGDWIHRERYLKMVIFPTSHIVAFLGCNKNPSPISPLQRLLLTPDFSVAKNKGRFDSSKFRSLTNKFWWMIYPQLLHTVDGWNPAPPRMMIIPLLTIPGGAGFLPSTVCILTYIWLKCVLNLGKYFYTWSIWEHEHEPKVSVTLEKDLEFGKKTRHGFSLLDADEERFLPNWAMKSMCFWYDKSSLTHQW